MPSVSTEIEIPAEPERVFAELTEPARYGEWNPFHAGWPDGVPTVAPGSSFTQRATFMGGSVDIRWTVVELQRPSTIVLDGQGPKGMAMRSAYRLRGDAHGTTLHLHSELEGAPAPLRRLVKRRAESAAAESLANLSALLAQEQAPAVEEAPADEATSHPRPRSRMRRRRAVRAAAPAPAPQRLGFVLAPRALVHDLVTGAPLRRAAGRLLRGLRS